MIRHTVGSYIERVELQGVLNDSTNRIVCVVQGVDVNHIQSKKGTFAIVNYYRGERPLCHFDMYRIDVDSLEDTGFYDYLDEGVTIACEWCENIESEIPDNAIYVDIQKGDAENERIITITGGKE